MLNNAKSKSSRSAVEFGSLRLKQQRGFTLVELMVVVAVIGVLAALAFQSASANARRVEVVNIRNNIVSLIRKAQAVALKNGVPVSLQLAGELASPGSEDLVNAFIWLDSDNDWVVDFPDEATWTVGSARVQSYVRGTGGAILSQNFPTVVEVAGCNNGIGGGHPQIAVLSPDGQVYDTVQNLCQFRIFIQNPVTGLSSQIQLQPSGQITYGDSF